VVATGSAVDAGTSAQHLPPRMIFAFLWSSPATNTVVVCPGASQVVHRTDWCLPDARLSVAGDVVIAASPRNPRHIICKRVLGLEGDTVCVPVTSRDDARTVKACSHVSAIDGCISCGHLTCSTFCTSACSACALTPPCSLVARHLIRCIHPWHVVCSPFETALITQQ